MIQKHYNQLTEEIKVVKKRSIQKQKRKNQYTVEFKFGSDIDFNTLVDILKVQMEIPSKLFLDPQIRFKSDIQIPQLSSYSEKLGCLMVDMFSRNYKVRKTDTRDNLLIITLDAYDTPFSDFDEYFEVLRERCPQVTQNLRKFQNMLDFYSYHPGQLNTFEQLNDFEQEVLKNFPAQGIITRAKDSSRTTVAKIYNNQLLQFLGVNREMISHYALETNLLPCHLYVDPNDERYFNVNKCYEVIFDPNKEIKIDFITYGGQRWFLPMETYRFVIPENDQNSSFFEYTFYVMKPEKYQFLDESGILENCKTYFNLKQLNLEQNQSNSETSEDQRQRCGFKSILEHRSLQI